MSGARTKPIVITNFLKENKNFQSEKKYPNSLSKNFKYDKAISDANKGDPFALAQLGKHFYDQGRKGEALQFFQAAIDAEKSILDFNLAYLIASSLPDNEPAKIDFYYRGLEYDLSTLQNHLSVNYGYAPPVIIKNAKEAVKFLLHKQDKNKDPMLAMFLSGPEVVGSFQVFGNILNLDGQNNYHTVYQRKKKEFFDSIKNNPDHFENIARALSLEKIHQLFKNGIPYNKKDPQQEEKTASEEANRCFKTLQDRLAEKIRQKMVEEDISFSQAMSFFTKDYHADYFVDIEKLVNHKLSESERTADVMHYAMQQTLIENNRVANVMLDMLDLNDTIQTLRNQLAHFFRRDWVHTWHALKEAGLTNPALTLKWTNDDYLNDMLTKNLSKEQCLVYTAGNVKGYTIYLQLKAFLAIQAKYNELGLHQPKPSAPRDPNSPPPYDDTTSADQKDDHPQIENAFNKLVTIAETVQTENEKLKTKFATLKSEPLEWQAWAKIFLSTVTGLILPFMLVSKIFKNTCRFWSPEALALAAKNVNQFSESTQLKEVTEYSTKETSKQTVDLKEYGRLTLLAGKKSTPPPAYPSPNSEENKKNPTTKS